MTMESGSVHNAMSVMIGLMNSIMSSTPTIVTTAEMACVRLSCRVDEMRSTSLTTRESVSPFECES